MSKTSTLIPVIRKSTYLAVFRNKAVTVKTSAPEQYIVYIYPVKWSCSACLGVVPNIGSTPVQFLENKGQVPSHGVRMQICHSLPSVPQYSTQ